MEFDGSKMLQDQRRTLAKEIIGFSGGTSASLRHEESECAVNKSALGPLHMHMSNYIYFVDPRLSSRQYLSDVKSNNMKEAVADRHSIVPGRCFYGSNLNICPSIVARSSGRKGDATGRQQFICFNSSQEPRLDKVFHSYQITPHGGGLEHGYVVPGLRSNTLAMESLKDQSRLKLKMFPFLAPVPQEPAGLMTMMGQQVVATGLTSSFPSASRPMLASGAPTTASSGQLTIFYKGQVNVYNNVEPAKVQDIMLMAAAHDSLPGPLELSTNTSDSHVPFVECEKLPHIDLNTKSEPDESKENPGGADLTAIRIRMMQEDEADSSIAKPNNNSVEELEPLVPQALPQARKASLTRFLERRRERLMVASPYCVKRSCN